MRSGLLFNPKSLLHQSQVALLSPDRIIGHEPDANRLGSGSHRNSSNEGAEAKKGGP
jgi:hypothetical protein